MDIFLDEEAALVAFITFNVKRIRIMKACVLSHHKKLFYDASVKKNNLPNMNHDGADSDKKSNADNVVESRIASDW